MSLKLGQVIRTAKTTKSSSIKFKKTNVKFRSDDKIYSGILTALTSIEKSIKSIIKNNKKTNKKKNVDKEDEKRKTRESKLEKGSKTLFKKLVKKPAKNFLSSFFDKIGNFLFFTFLGWLLKNFSISGGVGSFLSDMVTKFTPAFFDFVNNIIMSIFNTFVFFVEKGYQLHDELKKIVGNLGGKDSKKKFENLTDKLKLKFGFIATIGALMVAASGGLIGVGKIFLSELKKPEDTPDAAKGDTPDKPGAKGKDTSTSSKGGGSKKSGPVKSTKTGVNFSKNASSGVKAVGKAGKKTIIRTLGPLFKRLPIIGPLLNFGVNLVLGEPLGRALFMSIGASLLGIIGAAIGGPLAPLTAIAGGIAGDYLGGKLYDVFFKGKTTSIKGETQQAQDGGKVQSKRRGRIRKTRPKRTLKTIKVTTPPPKISTISSSPGRNVGGKDEIKKLFPDPTDIGGATFSSVMTRLNARNPYKAVSETGELMKEIPLFGSMMGAVADVILGQLPTKEAYNHLTDSIFYIINGFKNDTIAEVINKIPTLSSGGEVPERSLSLLNNELTSKQKLSKTIEKSISDKMRKSLSVIRKEVAKKDLELRGGGSGEFESGSSGSGFGGSAGGSYGGYAPTGMEKKIYDYLINEKGLNDIQALGLMANIQRESTFRSHAREPNGTGHGLFQWSHSRVAPFLKAVPDWETNWKAQIDYALSEPERLSLVAPGEYKEKQFKSPQEAADWWMREWERPASPSAGSKKHKEYLAAVPKGPEGSAKFRESVLDSSIAGSAFGTGLKTGPSRFIGGSSEFHIDTKIKSNMSMKDKVALVDQLAIGYASRGRKIEFSNAAVSDEVYDPNASYQEKVKLLQQVFSAHAPRNGWVSMDYYIPSTNENRRGKSAEGAEILSPTIPGGYLEYHKGGNYGAFTHLYDANGNLISKTGHGDIRGARSGKIKFDKTNIKKEFPAIQNGQEGVLITQEDGTRKWVEKKWSEEQRKKIEKDKKKKESSPLFGRPAVAAPSTTIQSGGRGVSPSIITPSNRINTSGRSRKNPIHPDKKEGGGAVFKQHLNKRDIGNYTSYNKPNRENTIAILPVIVRAPEQKISKTMGYPFISEQSGSTVTDSMIQLNKA